MAYCLLWMLSSASYTSGWGGSPAWLWRTVDSVAGVMWTLNNQDPWDRNIKQWYFHCPFQCFCGGKIFSWMKMQEVLWLFCSLLDDKNSCSHLSHQTPWQPRNQDAQAHAITQTLQLGATAGRKPVVGEGISSFSVPPSRISQSDFELEPAEKRKDRADLLWPAVGKVDILSWVCLCL